jgi:hypothetical protein
MNGEILNWRSCSDRYGTDTRFFLKRRNAESKFLILPTTNREVIHNNLLSTNQKLLQFAKKTPRVKEFKMGC